MPIGLVARVVVALAPLALHVTPAIAHFQVLLPSTEIVDSEASRAIELELVFTHPAEQGPVMEMGEPVRFGVVTPSGPIDLRESLVVRTVDGRRAYRASYTAREPGDHVFYVEPAPYWEPAEGTWIVHHTKVVVDVLGGGGGWDQPVGLPVEIEPLTRPYGLWAGNAFRGIVRRSGQPVPFAEVEVEHWNEGRRVTFPAEAFVTQVVKADANGVFSYTIPRAGWWGFAALVAGEERRASPEGEPAPVEQGGLLWVRAREMR